MMVTYNDNTGTQTATSKSQIMTRPNVCNFLRSQDQECKIQTLTLRLYTRCRQQFVSVDHSWLDHLRQMLISGVKRALEGAGRLAFWLRPHVDQCPAIPCLLLLSFLLYVFQFGGLCAWENGWVWISQHACMPVTDKLSVGSGAWDTRQWKQ